MVLIDVPEPWKLKKYLLWYNIKFAEHNFITERPNKAIRVVGSRALALVLAHSFHLWESMKIKLYVLFLMFMVLL